MKKTLILSVFYQFLVLSIFSQNKKSIDILANKMCEYGEQEINNSGDNFFKIEKCLTKLIQNDIPIHNPKYLQSNEDYQVKYIQKVSMKTNETCISIMSKLLLSSDEVNYNRLLESVGKCDSGDCANGYGKYVWSNGNYHVGFWIDNKKSGEGIYHYANGGHLKGNFVNDRLNGYGEEVKADGYKYVGQWKDGYYYGEGLLTWPNGETYMGGWDKNNKSGYGVYTYLKGAVHKGQYLDDKPHGPGEWTYSDGKMIGEWVNGKKEGEFKIIFLSIDKEESWVFENDKKIE